MVSSRPGIVTVIEPLQIVAQPVSQTVLPGSTVTFAITVTGHPAPTFQWRLNGVNIPGAISSSFIIPNLQPTNGGSYQVVLANLGGVLSSDIATLLVTSPALPFADNFDGRGTIDTGSAVGSGSNAGKTKEAGEPDHAGKAGGASVWLGWRAPASGIATFSTRGSGFDTLLGIFTGTTIAGLTNVTSDDDRGGFAISQASFNAVAGTEYLIAIDGFAGASGNIVLSWNLDTNTVPFPRILNQPLSQSVFAGANVTFSVDVTSLTAVTYQWFFGCREIIGATSSNLVILHAQQTDVGNYRVLVMTDSTKVATSLDAFLEIGPVPRILSHDKLEDLLNADVQGGGSPGGDPAAGPGGVSAFVSVAAGAVDAQILNNTGASTQPGEPSACGVIGGASKWFGLQPSTDGVMVLDTIGSAIDTVMAVYTGADLLGLQLITCDNNGAPDGIRSLVRFSAAQGTPYLVSVDGVNGAQGGITLNWKLGVAPVVISPFSKFTVHPGGSMLLSVTVTNAIPPPSYQWRLNGVMLVGATNGTLILNNLQATNAGSYSVVVSNFAGVVNNTNAVITVATPITLGYALIRNNGTFGFHVTGPSIQGFEIQATTNFVDWSPVFTNSLMAPLDFLDTRATNYPRRFYRVVPWP